MGDKVQEVVEMTLKDLLRRYARKAVLEGVGEKPLDTLGGVKSIQQEVVEKPGDVHAWEEY